MERKRHALEARITAMRSELEAEEVEMKRIIGEGEARDDVIGQGRDKMAVSRQADQHANGKSTSSKLRAR